MRKFKIGDRVKSLFPVGNKDIDSATGAVISILTIPSRDLIGVEFDGYIEGHSGINHTGRGGHCWNCIPEELEYIKCKVRKRSIINKFAKLWNKR